MPSNAPNAAAVWTALCLPLVLVAGGSLLLFGSEAAVAAHFAAWRAAEPGAAELVRAFTDWGNPVFYAIYAAMLVRGLLRRESLPVARALAYLAAQLIIALAVSRVFKIAIGKPRPGVGGPFVPLSLDAAHNSMPSGHTTEMGVQTSCLALWSPSLLGPLALGLLLALMGLSRLAMGAHHPTDLLAGMILGCLGGVLANRLVPRIDTGVARFFNRND